MDKIVVTVANLTADDRLRLAELFDATAGVMQPRFMDGHAEARVAFLRTVSAELRASTGEERAHVSGPTAAEDPSEFYGDGDPGTSA